MKNRSTPSAFYVGRRAIAPDGWAGKVEGSYFRVNPPLGEGEIFRVLHKGHEFWLLPICMECLGPLGGVFRVRMEIKGVTWAVCEKCCGFS